MRPEAGGLTRTCSVRVAQGSVCGDSLSSSITKSFDIEPKRTWREWNITESKKRRDAYWPDGSGVRRPGNRVNAEQRTPFPAFAARRWTAATWSSPAGQNPAREAAGGVGTG